MGADAARVSADSSFHSYEGGEITMSSIAGPALFAGFVVAQFAAVVVISRMHCTADSRAENGARDASAAPREPIRRGNERAGVVSLA